jgi:hypothetical protein
MAEKGFGAKKINLSGVSGTPKISSVNNLNINAVQVSISTDLSIGGSVQSNLNVGTGYSLAVDVGSNPAGPLQVGTYLTVFKDGNTSVSGIISAGQFVGDGSGLTGVTASGTGIEIKDDGSVVGVAGTINFADNLSVSALSGAAVTITGAGVSISVLYDSYTGSPTITASGSVITVGSTSNGYATRYVSAASTPSSAEGAQGDIWYYIGTT